MPIMNRGALSRETAMPGRFLADPLIYPGGSEYFYLPRPQFAMTDRD